MAWAWSASGIASAVRTGSNVSSPPETATVVDTTGAGDQYAAGVLLGLSRGLSLAEAGALGSLAASEVIAHWGPRPMVGLKDLAAQHGLSL